MFGWVLFAILKMFPNISFGDSSFLQLLTQATDTYNGCAHLTARSGLVREIQTKVLAFETAVDVPIVVVLQPPPKVCHSDFVKFNG